MAVFTDGALPATASKVLLEEVAEHMLLEPELSAITRHCEQECLQRKSRHAMLFGFDLPIFQIHERNHASEDDVRNNSAAASIYSDYYGIQRPAPHLENIYARVLGNALLTHGISRQGRTYLLGLSAAKAFPVSVLEQLIMAQHGTGHFEDISASEKQELVDSNLHMMLLYEFAQAVLPEEGFCKKWTPEEDNDQSYKLRVAHTKIAELASQLKIKKEKIAELASQFGAVSEESINALLEVVQEDKRIRIQRLKVLGTRYLLAYR